MNTINVARCELCRKLDKTSNMDFQTCELTGLSGYSHYECTMNDFGWLMEMVEMGHGTIVIEGDPLLNN